MVNYSKYNRIEQKITNNQQKMGVDCDLLYDGVFNMGDLRNIIDRTDPQHQGLGSMESQ